MKLSTFPLKDSSTLYLWFRSYLLSCYVEVRRYTVIVTIFNGYGIKFASFRFRKSDILIDSYFCGSFDELAFSFDFDLELLETPVMRILCRMALRRLSSRSLDILLDSYKSAYDNYARLCASDPLK